MDISNIGNVVETELLVIGGGLGGLFAGIKAKQNGAKNVLIVDKGAVSFSSEFRFAGGWIIYLLPEDGLEEWLKAFFLGQHGICNQDMLESFLVQSTERLREMEEMGLVYKKDPGSKSYLRMPSRGLGPVKMAYPPTYKDLEGGPAVTSALRDEALRLGVEFSDKVFISDLIVQDNRVQGAVGCHRRTGDFHIFKAKAVVMAAGDCSFRGNYACVEQVTGDAFATAYRAAADLTNMEFFTFNTGPLNFNFRGTGPVASLGATFLNASDEDFMPKYHPQASRAELHYIVQAMAQEAREGHGPPFYYDFRPTPPTMEESLFLSQGGWMARSLIRFKEKGVSIFDRKVEWIPVPMTLRGGLVTDINCMTNIEGLFAVGTAHSTGPGVFTGWSAGKCLWTGYTAGTSAAKCIEDSESKELDLDNIVHLKNRLFNHEIHPDKGERTINEITRMLQRIVFSFETSILKSEDRLTKALKDMESIAQSELPKAKIPNLHEFIKFKETENMIRTADLFLKASRVRRESRGDHRREDYPDPDNREWLKWIVFNKNLTEGYRLEKMPWEKYKYQPTDLEG